MIIIDDDKMFGNIYRCNEKTMRWLTLDCKIPLFSYDNKYYYFLNTEALQNALKKMPLYLRISNRFSGNDF